MEDIYKCLKILKIYSNGYCLTNNNKILVLGEEEKSFILFSSKTKESSSKEIKVFDNQTNVSKIYPSIRKAASAIEVDVKSLNRHCLLTGDLGLRTLYKNRYFIEVIKSKKLHSLTKKHCDFNIELKDLQKDKVYFFWTG